MKWRIDQLGKGASLAVLAISAVALLFGAPQLSGKSTDGALAQARGEGSESASGSGRRTRRLEQLRPQVFKVLTEAQELMEAKQNAQAKRILQNELNRGELNGHETALVQQLLGGLYANDGDFKQAANYWERAVNSQALPLGAEITLRGQLGQVYVALGQYRKAISYINQWIAEAESVPPDTYYLLALAHYNLKQFDSALNNALEAHNRSKPQVVEKYIDLVSVLYLQRGRYRDARPFTELGVANFTAQKKWWTRLAAIYNELKLEKDYFAVLEMMYRQDMLDKSAQLENLAALYITNDTPYKAGRLLEREIKAGRVKKSKDNWEMLANAWSAAREWDKAVQPLKNAAALSSDGELYIRLGQTYINDDEWQQAEANINRGLQRGGLDNEGLAWLLLGIARYNLEKTDSALEAFARSTDYEDTKIDAKNWLKSLDREKKYATLIARIEQEEKFKEIEERKKKLEEEQGQSEDEQQQG